MKKIRSSRQLQQSLLVVALALVVFPISIVAVRILDRSTGEHPANAGEVVRMEPEPEEMLFYQGVWYQQRQDLETTLILGVDKYADNEAVASGDAFEQADFLMLLVVDRARERYYEIQINRDTMTEIQLLTNSGVPFGRKVTQITLAHTYARDPKINCLNTVDAVSNLMYGIQIDHYLSLTLDSIVTLNDLVGGVTVEVLDDLTSQDSRLVKGSTVTLKGQQAMTYIRSRRGLDDPTNLNRMARQRQYILALQEQFERNSQQDADFMLNALFSISDYLVSDCTVEEMSELISQVSDYELEDFTTPEGEQVVGDGHMEFHVDDAALRALVLSVFFEPSSDV